MNETDCDHKSCAEIVRMCVEIKCAGCGQIKCRRTLEECYCSNDNIEHKVKT